MYESVASPQSVQSDTCPREEFVFTNGVTLNLEPAACQMRILDPQHEILVRLGLHRC